MNNVLDLLNFASTPGLGAGMGAGIGAGSIPGFAPGAQQFGASTVPRIGGSNMSMEGIMPFVAQILGMRRGGGLTTLGEPMIDIPQSGLNPRIAAINPGYNDFMSQRGYTMP